MILIYIISLFLNTKKEDIIHIFNKIFIIKFLNINFKNIIIFIYCLNDA